VVNLIESNDRELKGLNMQAKLMTEFRNDPLYRIFVDRNQEYELFNYDFIVDLEDTRLYSTTEVAEMFGIPVGTLRNYIYALDEYIRPIGAGRLIKLNYEAIFRLHMIFNLKGEYSVPMLQSKLLGRFKLENESKEIVPSPQIENLEKDVAQIKTFLSEIGKLGLFKLSGTDPSNLQLTLNAELLERMIQGVIASKYQPLLEGKNEEIENLQRKLETLTEKLAQSEEENRRLKEEVNQVRKEVGDQFHAIKHDHEEETRRFEDFERAMREIRTEKMLRRKALEEWSKLSFFSRLGKNQDEFVEKYISDHIEEYLKKQNEDA
jgi:regulator of replication initiation timing